MSKEDWVMRLTKNRRRIVIFGVLGFIFGLGYGYWFCQDVWLEIHDRFHELWTLKENASFYHLYSLSQTLIPLFGLFIWMVGVCLALTIQVIKGDKEKVKQKKTRHNQKNSKVIVKKSYINR